MWFYGWGFYALGQDNTLERQLTGQPTKSQTPPIITADGIGISSHGKPPVEALPQKERGGGAGSGSSPGALARATAAGDGVTIIDIDQCKEEHSNTTAVVGASNADKGGGEGDNNNGWAGLKKRVWRILSSPNIIAVAIGVVIAMIAPLQKLLFDNPRAILRPVGAAIEVRVGDLLWLSVLAHGVCSERWGQEACIKSLRRECPSSASIVFYPLS